MSNRLVSTTIIGVAALALASCTSPAASPAPDARAAEAADPSPVPDTAVFDETSVWVAADGSMRVATRPVTAGEQRARNAERERAAHGGPIPEIARDTACSGSSFWLYDRQDWTGNEICFAGAGVQTLHLLGFIRPVCGPRFCYLDTWLLHAGSYWAGVSPGALWTGPSPGYPVDGGVNYALEFAAWAKQSFDVGTTLYVDHLDLAQ